MGAMVILNVGGRGFGKTVIGEQESRACLTPSQVKARPHSFFND